MTSDLQLTDDLFTFNSLTVLLTFAMTFRAGHKYNIPAKQRKLRGNKRRQLQTEKKFDKSKKQLSPFDFVHIDYKQAGQTEANSVPSSSGYDFH